MRQRLKREMAALVTDQERTFPGAEAKEELGLAAMLVGHPPSGHWHVYPPGEASEELRYLWETGDKEFRLYKKGLSVAFFI